jgi:cyanophycin synthetase
MVERVTNRPPLIGDNRHLALNSEICRNMNKRDMVIKSVVYLRGPNIWTYFSALEAVVDIGDLEDCPSNLVPGLYERLVAWLPSLIEHRCSPGVRGGFLQRLQTGTWPCHILEHVTLALQDLAGVPGHGFGRARETETRGVYKVVVSGWQEEVTRAALYAGRNLVMAAIEDQPYDLEAALEHIKELSQDLCLGPSTASMVLAAEERDIPAVRLNQGNLIQFDYGNQQRRIWTAETDQTSAIAETISRDKDLTKSILEACGVPIPQGRAVENAHDAWEAAQDLGLPVVIKPVDGNHGRGVFINLETQQEIEAAYAVAVDEGSGVLVERFIRGNEHRLLIVNGKLAAAAKGQAALVTGDGKHTINELIALQINSDPRRGRGEGQPLNPVRIDSAARLELKRQGFEAESVVPAGCEVLIQRNGNVAFDCTDDVHPEVAVVAALAAKAVGLDIAGIDLVCEDISRPLAETGGAIVEVNAGPGLLMHLKPAEGQPRDVGKAIIEYMFPPANYQTFPLIGVTGSSGMTQVTQIVFHLLKLSGLDLGLSNSKGVWVGDRRMPTSVSSKWSNTQRLLLNCQIQAAVVETDGMQLLTEGLDYIKCLVGIVTDIRFSDAFKGPTVAYHNFETAPDLIKIYRTQIDVICQTGTGVLNADDPNVAAIAEYCEGLLTYFSQDPQGALITAHLAAGKRAVLLDSDEIVLAQGEQRTLLCSVATLPVLSASQAARHENMVPVLASVAAAWALNLPLDLIRSGLRSY